jgi:hypothetical protein
MVKSYLPPDEYETLVGMAGRAGLSLSTFIREVCRGYPVKTFEHEAFKLDLIKTRADLGRLGGLLKAALGLETGTGVDQAEIRRLLGEINRLQRKLTEAVPRL